MVERIGSGGLAREALIAALRKQAAEHARVRSAQADVAASAGAAPEGAARAPGFAEALQQGIRAVDLEVKAAERLPEDVALGNVQDFHEVAARIKRADLSFKVAMEIRNKLIDAYREVMRMPV